ncbi:unnamed protein product [Umbelopsis ramanniana]
MKDSNNDKKIRSKNRVSKYPPLPPAFRRVTRSQTLASRLLQSNVSSSRSASEMTPLPPRESPLSEFPSVARLPTNPQQVSEKENAPAGLNTLKPSVAHLPMNPQPVFDKENSPASPDALKPFVARPPIFRQNNEPITRRHSFSLPKPYSPERLQNVKPKSKSAEAATTRNDWFGILQKPVKRDLIAAFVAVLPKSSTAKFPKVDTPQKSISTKFPEVETPQKSSTTKIPEVETAQKSSTTKIPEVETAQKSSTTKIPEVATPQKAAPNDDHVFAIPNLKMYRRAQYFHKLVQQKKKEYQEQVNHQANNQFNHQ